MSVDINWEALTGGPDGAELAETIRDFIHQRFQAIPLPRLIRSVCVHSFEFGKIAPQIVLKDISDPLPDFYEATEDDDDDAGDDGDDDEDQDSHILDERAGSSDEKAAEPSGFRHLAHRQLRQAQGSRRQSELEILTASSMARGATPGVLGTTSNLGYFHLPLSAGLSGTQTPLAAVAGAHFTGGSNAGHGEHHHADSFSSVSPPSTATPASSQDHAYHDGLSGSSVAENVGISEEARNANHAESSPEDLQVVFHVTYTGDVKLSLTAEVFLDYPMPSFVGIPLKLKITGITFNGAGIVAYIKKRAHLCFLNPEDANALIGEDSAFDSGEESMGAPGEVRSESFGALLEHIKIESEMGETDSGKQVLKNVGKIEKFILEQVQRIFEDEFVYPSFWTFLV